MDEPLGYLCPVLHAHLPYVRHPEHEEFLEERWFFEAVTESYLPLLRLCERLEDDGVEYHLLLSLSPTLVAMLEDPLLQERYLRHLHRLVDLAGREAHRFRHDAPREALATWYLTHLRETLYWFEERCRRRLALAFGRVASQGHLELMTASATHAFLPLLRRNPEVIRAQVQIARDYFREVFEVPPGGLWLPECAYTPGLEAPLAAAELRYFLLDTHGIEDADRRPPHGVYTPLYTPNGVAAFGRDPESGRQVWSAEEGYPGHPLYREFYRDIGFERETEYLGELVIDGTLRCDTGLKYWRITGREEKELYDPHAAREQAARHAEDFLARRQEQVRRLAPAMGRRPVVVAPYDAELFGHWWFEGPVFLEMLLRKMHYDQNVLGTTTPARYLQEYPTNPVATPAASSWGAGGSFEHWLGEENRWVYPLLHAAADRFVPLAARAAAAPPESLAGRALRQAGRELLLAQSSDWTFIMRTGTSPAYAGRRVRDHLARLDRLCGMLEADTYDEPLLAAVEELDALFAHLDPAHFAPAPAAAAPPRGSR